MPERLRNCKLAPDVLEAIDLIAKEPKTIADIAHAIGRGEDAVRGWLAALVAEKWVVMRGHRFTPHKRGALPVLYEAGPRLLKLRGAP